MPATAASNLGVEVSSFLGILGLGRDKLWELRFGV